MKRLEQLFFAFCLAAWFVGLLATLGVVDLAGRFEVALYPLFTLAAALGWVCGNVWVHRTRSRPAEVARRFWVLYFFGPPGILYLLRSMAPVGERSSAPLVPLLSFGVYAALFLVPVLLRPRRRARFDLRRETAERDRRNARAAADQDARRADRNESTADGEATARRTGDRDEATSSRHP